MGLWRDPLDDLIEDLERAASAEPTPSPYDLHPRVEDLQLAVPRFRNPAVIAW